MKFRLIKINKPTFDEAQHWVDEYAKRLKRFCDFELKTLKEGADEAKLCKQIKDKNGLLVLVDERGQEFSSKSLATHIKKWQDTPQIKSVSFLIGGSHGVSPETRSEADLSVSLSPFVLQGDIAWLLTAEQIYRAFNINAGTGYHHE
jgi:23S rRNA (pseudouridine1915-N3)-methyltransferase